MKIKKTLNIVTALILGAIAIMVLGVSVYAQTDTSEYSKKQLESITKFLGYKNDEGVANYELLGMTTASDMENLDGITWSDNSIKVIEKINIEDKNLVGNLDLSDVPTVLEIDVSGNKISGIEIGENLLLDRLDIKNNEITTLDISKCSKLKKVDLSENYLQNIEMDYDNVIETIDVSDNLLNFNTIPKEYINGEIAYENQKEVFVIAHSQVGSLFADKKVDFSYYGADKYNWYDEQDNEIFPLEENGKFIFTKDYIGKNVYCVMSSEQYDGLTLKTELISIIAKDYSLLIMSSVFLVLVGMLIFVIKYFKKKK